MLEIVLKWVKLQKALHSCGSYPLFSFMFMREINAILFPLFLKNNTPHLWPALKAMFIYYLLRFIAHPFLEVLGQSTTGKTTDKIAIKYPQQ